MTILSGTSGHGPTGYVDSDDDDDDPTPRERNEFGYSYRMPIDQSRTPRYFAVYAVLTTDAFPDESSELLHWVAVDADRRRLIGVSRFADTGVTVRLVQTQARDPDEMQDLVTDARLPDGTVGAWAVVTEAPRPDPEVYLRFLADSRFLSTED